MMDPKTLKAVIRVLKKHFTNLSAERSIDIATEIIEAVEADRAEP